MHPSLSSQPRLVTLVISPRIPKLASLGILVDTAVASLLPHRQSAQPKPPCRYSYENNPDKSNQSRVRVGPGLSPTLTLTSDSDSPTSQENRTSQSSMRSHNCQRIRPLLTIPPDGSPILTPMVSIAILPRKFR